MNQAIQKLDFFVEANFLLKRTKILYRAGHYKLNSNRILEINKGKLVSAYISCILMIKATWHKIQVSKVMAYTT